MEFGLNLNTLAVLLAANLVAALSGITILKRLVGTATVLPWLLSVISMFRTMDRLMGGPTGMDMLFDEDSLENNETYLQLRFSAAWLHHKQGSYFRSMAVSLGI